MGKLTLVFISLILLSLMAQSGIAQTESDYALIRRPIVTQPEEIWEINRSLTIQYFDNDMFHSPVAAVFAFDYNTVTSSYRSTFMGVVDKVYNRMIYADLDNTVIKSAGTFGTSNNQFKWPRGIAAHSISDGYSTSGYYDIYIADTYNDRISRLRYYAPTHQVSFVTPIAGNGLYHPKDVAFNDPGRNIDNTDDEVFVLNGDNTILRCSYDGSQLLETIHTPAGCNASAIAHGFWMRVLYVVDTANDRIYKYMFDHTAGTYASNEVSDAATTSSVVDMQVDGYGHPWTVDASGTFTKYDCYSLWTIDPICTFGSAGTGVNEFYQPSGFTIAESPVGRSGDVFIVEEWTDNTGIQHYAIGTDILDNQVISNPEQTIHNIVYTLVDPSDVDTKIVDDAGSLVRVLCVNESQVSGQQTILWDGLDDNDDEVATGVYTYTIKATSRYVGTVSGEPVNVVQKSGTFYHVGPCPDPSEDPDFDRICGDEDNCFEVYNPFQEDEDNDGVGDVCDNCPNDNNPDQANSDDDSYGDVCDNCPYEDNPGQEDSDGDGDGNACDHCPNLPYQPYQDYDCDSVGAANDNCPQTFNPYQENSDTDSLGDACDNCPTANNDDQKDWDCDGVGDACDLCYYVPDPDNSPDACVCSPEKLYEWGYRVGCTPHPDLVRDVAALADGSLIFVGYVDPYLYVDTDSLLIIKTSSCGHYQWRKTLTCPPEGWRGHSVAATSDGGFVVAGRGGCYCYDMVLLVKFNADGDTLWSRTYGDEWGHDIAWAVEELSSGDLIVAGEFEQTGSTFTDAFLMKTNPNGEEIWTRTYNKDGRESYVFYDVAEKSSDTLVACGYYTEPSYPADTSQCAVLMDGAGNVLEDDPPFDMRVNVHFIYSVDVTDDGGFVFAGEWVSWDSQGSGTYSKAAVYKVSANWQVVDWYRYYLGPGLDEDQAEARSVEQADDGSIFVCGMTFYSARSQRYITFKVLDSGGTLLHSMDFTTIRESRGNGLVIAGDGNCVIAGETDGNVYILKTSGIDSDGDGVPDAVDNCPDTANSDQANADADSLGDVCDNCDSIPNPTQLNSDADTLGNACDNCPDSTNNDQMDSDGDGIGDVCESCCLLMGDFTHDGAFNPLDAVAFVQWMWGTSAAPFCLDECDVNCSCAVDPLDAVYMTNHLWKGGPPPCTCEEMVENCF